MICPMCRTESPEGTTDCPKCSLHFVPRKQKEDLAAKHWEFNEFVAAIFGTLALISTVYCWAQFGFHNTYTIVSLTVTVICVLFFLVSALERFLNKM